MGETRLRQQADLVVVDHRPVVVAGLHAILDGGRWRLFAWNPDAALETSPGPALVALALPEPVEPVAFLASEGFKVGLYGDDRDPVMGAALAAGAVAFIRESAPAERWRSVVKAMTGDVSVLLPDRVRRRFEEARADVAAVHAALTRREREILEALADGLRPAEIAARDFVSVTTVRNQVQSILTKLNVHSRLEAVAIANRLGWRRSA
jgi:DNA-binding NarL/FixJ family response regulator